MDGSRETPSVSTKPKWYDLINILVRVSWSIKQAYLPLPDRTLAREENYHGVRDSWSGSWNGS